MVYHILWKDENSCVKRYVDYEAEGVKPTCIDAKYSVKEYSIVGFYFPLDTL